MDGTNNYHRCIRAPSLAASIAAETAVIATGTNNSVGSVATKFVRVFLFFLFFHFLPEHPTSSRARTI